MPGQASRCHWLVKPVLVEVKIIPSTLSVKGPLNSTNAAFVHIDSICIENTFHKEQGPDVKIRDTLNRIFL